MNQELASLDQQTLQDVTQDAAMPSFPEQSAVYPTTPDKLLGAFKRLDTLLPKLIPSVFSKAHKFQGDGGAGTIAEYVYTPGTHLPIARVLILFYHFV